jgi:hypothetical protein
VVPDRTEFEAADHYGGRRLGSRLAGEPDAEVRQQAVELPVVGPFKDAPMGFESLQEREAPAQIAVESGRGD